MVPTSAKSITGQSKHRNGRRGPSPGFTHRERVPILTSPPAGASGTSSPSTIGIASRVAGVEFFLFPFEKSKVDTPTRATRHTMGLQISVTNDTADVVTGEVKFTSGSLKAGPLSPICDADRCHSLPVRTGNPSQWRRIKGMAVHAVARKAICKGTSDGSSLWHLKIQARAQGARRFRRKPPSIAVAARQPQAQHRPSRVPNIPIRFAAFARRLVPRGQAPASTARASPL